MNGSPVAPMVVQQKDKSWRSQAPTILSRTSFIVNSPEMSDVKFVFKKTDESEERTIYGHKFILALGSSVFHKIFFEQNEQFTTVVGDTVDMTGNSFSPEAFLTFVKFLYTDKIDYANEGLSVENFFGILNCGDYYDVPFLRKDSVKQIEKIMTKTTAIQILETAVLFRELELAEKSLEFIDQNLRVVLESEESLSVKLETLFEILKRDSLDIDECFILDFALKWAENKCKCENLDLTPENKRNVLGQVFFEIRFGLLTSAKISELVSFRFLTPFESTDILLDVHSAGSTFKRIAPDVSFKSKPRIVGQKAKKLTETKTKTKRNKDIDYLKIISSATIPGNMLKRAFPFDKLEEDMKRNIERMSSALSNTKK